MKKMKILSMGILSVLLLGGCAQRELVFSQDALCPSPIANVYLQGVHKKGGHGAVNEEEFGAILEGIMKGTGCIQLISSPQEGAYTLNATYEATLQNDREKSTFKSKSSNVLSTKVVLNLSNQEVIRRDYGEAKISAEENKVLGVGESEQITKEDEEKALKGSTLAALKSFISALQASKEVELQDQELENMTKDAKEIEQEVQQ